MSLLDEATFLMVPSGYKAGKILSTIPTSDKGDLTFTRNSTATRVNSSGVIETVLPNVPRIDYSSGVPSLLLEPQRTNLCVNSNFTLGTIGEVPTSWIERGLHTGRKIIDSQSTSGFALRVTSQGGAVASTDDVRQAISGLSIGSPHTVSFYAKTAPGSTQTSLNVVFAATDAPTSILTNTYQRFSYTFTPSNTSHSLFFGGGNGLIADIRDINIELGSFSTSYIPTPTTATVTRVAENSYVDIVNTLNPNNFTALFTGTFLGVSFDNKVIGVSDTIATGGNSNDLGFYANGRFIPIVGGNIQSIVGSSLPYGTPYKCLIRRNGNTVSAYRNGSLLSTQTIEPFPYRYLHLNNGGCSLTVTQSTLFNQALTDSQCIALTT